MAIITPELCDYTEFIVDINTVEEDVKEAIDQYGLYKANEIIKNVQNARKEYYYRETIDNDYYFYRNVTSDDLNKIVSKIYDDRVKPFEHTTDEYNCKNLNEELEM